MSDDFGIWFSVCDGLVLVMAGLPMYLRWVPPNSFWGFRVAATLEDRERWYWSNRRAGRRLILTGVASPIAALLAAELGGNSLVCGAIVMVLGCVWMVVKGWREVARDAASS